jgi:hypothetical protein
MYRGQGARPPFAKQFGRGGSFWPVIRVLVSSGDQKFPWAPGGCSITPPLKRKSENKVTIKTTPKKRHEHRLLCWPADAKKTIRAGQEEVVKVIFEKNITRFKARCTPFRLMPNAPCFLFALLAGCIISDKPGSVNSRCGYPLTNSFA